MLRKAYTIKSVWQIRSSLATRKLQLSLASHTQRDPPRMLLRVQLGNKTPKRKGRQCCREKPEEGLSGIWQQGRQFRRGERQRQRRRRWGRRRGSDGTTLKSGGEIDQQLEVASDYEEGGARQVSYTRLLVVSFLHFEPRSVIPSYFFLHVLSVR